MKYPRILVISNNSFSNTDSNGRTLGNLFCGWPKEDLAQFCISTDGANFDLCDNYYCLTDREVLRAFLHFRKAEGKTLTQNEKEIKGSRGKGKKTLLMMMGRNLIWGNQRWKSNAFIEWVNAFNPEIIMLMFSDSGFILKIGTALAKDLDIPLVMFNTEGYYFFKSNYCRTKTKWDWALFPIYQCLFRKQVRKTMKRVVYTIYLNTLLQKDYSHEFGGPSAVLYTSSSLKNENHIFCNEKPIFSYIGNLTFNRPEALMEVADVLQSLNKDFKLNVYGKPMNLESENALINHPGISFKGFVNYDEVQRIIRNSDILFHAETKDKRWKESLKYGFSTKIADSISSGACFVLYAPEDIACSLYLKDTKAGWYAGSKKDLKLVLEEILSDESRRNEILGNARRVALENHNQNNNCLKFQKIIIDCVKNIKNAKDSR